MAVVGLTDRESAVYRAALRHPEHSPTALARECGVTVATVRKALASLVQEGLARSVDGTVVMERPDLAAAARLAAEERALLERQEALLQARRDVNDLVDVYLAGAVLSESADLYRVEGYPAIRAGLEECGLTATQRMATINVGLADPDGFAAQRTYDELLMSRGVRLATVMPTAVLDAPPNLEQLVSGTAVGEEYRLLDHPPLTLVLFDQSVAVIPVDRYDVSRGAMFLRSPSLVQPMVALFELTWEVARPFLAGAGAVEELGARDVVLLGLLAAGLNDDAIARQLRLGVRTVRRDIARLLEQLGARSRFEAGVLAARRGWL